ncbi:hypothetical protein SAMN05216273_105120 [Chryseobacterium taihuense]|uniref:Uncharacterized protein n=3 Tax=Chryseobacterium taihuense TaxID=1141221 RepID=A0ABY0QSG0_9FLAO|nr:hypothetical protein SAMN05216273_105120 [Chryseobacterium taihuense]
MKIGERQYKTIIKLTKMMKRFMMYLVLLLNNFFLKKLTIIPAITRKAEIKKDAGGVWLSEYPNLIPQNIESIVPDKNMILVAIQILKSYFFLNRLMQRGDFSFSKSLS